MKNGGEHAAITEYFAIARTQDTAIPLVTRKTNRAELKSNPTRCLIQQHLIS